MAQSYKKGRKFKTESPALLPVTRGGRPAAASRTPVSIPPLCTRHYPRLCFAVGIRFPHLRPHPRFCAAVSIPSLYSPAYAFCAAEKRGRAVPNKNRCRRNFVEKSCAAGLESRE